MLSKQQKKTTTNFMKANDARVLELIIYVL